MEKQLPQVEWREKTCLFRRSCGGATLGLTQSLRSQGATQSAKPAKLDPQYYFSSRDSLRQLKTCYSTFQLCIITMFLFYWKIGSQTGSHIELAGENWPSLLGATHGCENPWNFLELGSLISGWCTGLDLAGTSTTPLSRWEWRGPSRFRTEQIKRLVLSMEIQVKPENATRMAPLDWTPAMRLETYSLMAKHVPGALCYTRSCLYTNPVKSFIRECGCPWRVQLLPQTAQGVADTLPKEPPS